MNKKHVYILLMSIFAVHASANLIPQMENFLEASSQARYPEAEISVQVLPLDPRLKLKPCKQYEFTLRSQKPIGRVAVGVRCLQPNSWAIYLPAQVEAKTMVVVVSGGIERGKELTASDLTLEARDLSKIRTNFLTSVKEAKGFEATRRLQAGSVVYSNLIKKPLVIKRGERVNIQAGSGGIVISAIGEALQDGAYGQQIKIRNLQSKKVVHAWVASHGQVTTQSVSKISNLR